MRSCFFVLALMFSTALFGQEEGRLTGSVVDPSGAALAHAQIKVLLPGGTHPLFQSETTQDGLFRLPGLRPNTYDLLVEAAGFAPHKIAKLAVDPGRETSLPAIRMELGTTAQTLDVQDQVTQIQTTNAEVTSTLSNEQMHLLPQLDRSPLALIATQAGVGSNGLENTTINGQRTSLANVTFAGINVQDNYLRENGLDFLPNLLLEDEVQEVTITTSNSNPAMGGGSAQIAFSPPSGTDTFHAKLYWFNRNNVTAANDWFQNQAGVALPFLNQNQIGGALGGFIIPHKLYFYVNYEAFRNRQQSSVIRTIFTADALQGIFTYKNTRTGLIQKVNVLQAAGVAADPTVAKLLSQLPGPQQINNFSVGDSTAGNLRNTAGYLFLQRANRDRNNALGNFDYYATAKHSFNFVYKWNSDAPDRGDVQNGGFSPTPLVTNQDSANLLSAAWRWSVTPSLTNEVRGGYNLAPGIFTSSQTFPAAFIIPALVDNPIDTFQNQGRYTNTYSISDSGNYTHGRHTVQFGYQSQWVHVKTYDFSGTIPQYALGISAASTIGLSATQLPGISANALADANALLATVGGIVASAAQTFNVTSRTSGFVPAASNTRNLTNNNLAFYLGDNWKVFKNLAVTLGVRYEYYFPVNETGGLALIPRLENGNAIQTLLDPNAVLDFAGGNTGRSLYKSDRNNFAPNVGLAWDVFGNGRTALRAGYSINFVNDEFLRTTENNAIDTNSGLVSIGSLANLTDRVSKLPAISTPVLQIPRTTADNYALDTTNPVAIPDPNLVTPYVQQWNIGIQQQIKGFVIDVKYVGNHGTKLFRSIDYNQVIIQQNGFLADFLRAQNNAALSQAAGKAYNPVYNPAIAGSQVLTVFPHLTSGGFLSNSTVRSDIQTGQVGALAELYAVDSLNGSVQFFQNPNALGADMVTNYSNSTYNGLQADISHRFHGGLSAQANYTFSKVLSDAAGDTQERFEPFQDINNAKLEKSRAPFNQTHVFKANYIYELPFGAGKRFDMGRTLNRVLGGFSTSGLLTWSSGSPFSFFSGRATFNRPSRSVNNTAVSSLTAGQINSILGLRFDGNGAYFVSKSAVNPDDGTGVAPDGSPAFTGQAFSNPTAGNVGTLSKNQFDGPSWFAFDAGVQKVTHVTEKLSVELRAEAINVLNHPTFFVGNQNINGTDFGIVGTSLLAPRVVQFGLYVKF
jgi:hypothetical protein